MTQTRIQLWILEDNDEDFELIQFAIKRFHLPIYLQRFLRAEDLIDGLRDRQPPNAIFLDLRMPGGGGMFALKKMADTGNFRNIPKLVFSTSANPQEISEAYQYGAYAFHIKSTKTDEMLDTITHTLQYWFACVTLDTPSAKPRMHSQEDIQ